MIRTPTPTPASTTPPSRYTAHTISLLPNLPSFHDLASRPFPFRALPPFPPLFPSLSLSCSLSPPSPFPSLPLLFPPHPLSRRVVRAESSGDGWAFVREEEEEEEDIHLCRCSVFEGGMLPGPGLT